MGPAMEIESAARFRKDKNGDRPRDDAPQECEPENFALQSLKNSDPNRWMAGKMVFKSHGTQMQVNLGTDPAQYRPQVVNIEITSTQSGGSRE